EIFVFTSTESVSFHDDAAPEAILDRVETRERLAFLRSEDVGQRGVSLFIQVSEDFLPVERFDVRDRPGCFRECRADFGCGRHRLPLTAGRATVSLSRSARLRSTPHR